MRHWLDYDSVAFAVLMIALGMVEVLGIGHLKLRCPSVHI
jgi:hypothetical protein